MNPYKELCTAIIVQAVKDWKQSLTYVRRHPNAIAAFETKRECEEFFLSDWFAMLTEIDGKWLLDSLRKEKKK